MTKVAYVISSQVLGGHEFQSLELMRRAVRRCEVRVFFNSYRIAEQLSSIDADVEVRELAFFKPGVLPLQICRGIWHARRIRRIFREFDSVVVCAGAIEASLQVGVAMLGTEKTILYLPFLYDRRELWGRIGCVYTLALRLLLNVFPKLITINRIQARLLSSFYRGEIKVVRNVIQYVPLTTSPSGLPRIVCIGRLDRQKQFAELLQALDTPRNPFKELLIIGEGSERERLQDLANRTTSISVRLLGWKSAVEQASILRLSDVLVVNSVIEGEPMVIREANQRGMHVFARRIDGVRGVTKRQNRFRNYQELIDRLISLHDRLQQQHRSVDNES